MARDEPRRRGVGGRTRRWRGEGGGRRSLYFKLSNVANSFLAVRVASVASSLMVMPDRQMPRRGPSALAASLCTLATVVVECGGKQNRRRPAGCRPRPATNDTVALALQSSSPRQINLPGGCLRQTPSPQLPSHRPRGSHNRAREAAFYRRLPGSGGRGWVNSACQARGSVVRRGG